MPDRDPEHSGAPSARAASSAATPAKYLRVDCQSHRFCPAIIDYLERRTVDPLVYRRGDDRFVKMGDWHRRILPKHLDVDAKLADMDACGIDVTALSVNDPGPEWFGDEGPERAREMNDFVADVVRRHPTRFFGLCVLPLCDVDASLAELDRCAGDLGMKGLLLYTNLAGRFPDEPQFLPVWERCVALGMPVLLHPAMPVTTDLVKDYELTSTLGNMFDDTIALARIVMSGLLDRFPSLELVCPHLGGTLPYIIGRLDHQTQVLKRGPKHLTRKPSDYLKRVWLDVVSPLPEAMALCHRLLGPRRMLFASDHPWVDPQLIIEHLQSLHLPPEDEALILGGNAQRLFKL